MFPVHISLPASPSQHLSLPLYLLMISSLISCIQYLLSFYSSHLSLPSMSPSQHPSVSPSPSPPPLPHLASILSEILVCCGVKLPAILVIVVESPLLRLDPSVHVSLILLLLLHLSKVLRVNSLSISHVLYVV